MSRKPAGHPLVSAARPAETPHPRAQAPAFVSAQSPWGGGPALAVLHGLSGAGVPQSTCSWPVEQRPWGNEPCSGALTSFLGPQAHIYSLGATLKAALEYGTEPELEPRLSQDLEVLLRQMQAEDPSARPDLEVHGHPRGEDPRPPLAPGPRGHAHARGPPARTPLPSVHGLLFTRDPVALHSAEGGS